MDWRTTLAEFATKHLTKTGVIGGGLYVLSRLAAAIYHRSLDQLFDAIGYGGLLLIAAGAVFEGRKAVGLAVEAKAERAAIARTVGVETDAKAGG